MSATEMPVDTDTERGGRLLVAHRLENEQGSIANIFGDEHQRAEGLLSSTHAITAEGDKGIGNSGGDHPAGCWGHVSEIRSENKVRGENTKRRGTTCTHKKTRAPTQAPHTTVYF